MYFCHLDQAPFPVISNCSFCHPNQALLSSRPSAAPLCHLDQARGEIWLLSLAVCIASIACYDSQISRLRPTGSARNDKEAYFGCNKSNAPHGMTICHLDHTPFCHLDQAQRAERSACSYWSMLFAGFTLTMGRFLDSALRASLEMTKEHLPCHAVMAMPLTATPMPLQLTHCHSR